MDKWYNKDCFAYYEDKNEVERCFALKRMQCYKCKFAKTKKEYEKGLKGDSKSER